jgi:hypothetical protein
MRAISRTSARSTRMQHRSRAGSLHESGSERATRELATAAAELPLLASYFEIAMPHGDLPPGMRLTTESVAASITEMSFDGPFAV